MRTSRVLLAALVATTALVLSSATLAVASVVDQQQTSAGFDVSLSDDEAQTFTAGVSGQMDRVDVKLAKDVDSTRCPGSPNITVEIRTTDGTGTPTETVLRSETISYADIPTTAAGTAPSGFNAVQLSLPLAVTKGTKYAIVLPQPGRADLLCFRWFGEADSYAGGSSFYKPLLTDTWHADIVDFAFRTYVSGNTSTALSGCPTSTKIGIAVSCTVTVGNAGSGSPTTPTGAVGGSVVNGTGDFSGCGSLNGSGQCTLSYTPTSIGTGVHTVFAQYIGDAGHLGSSGSRNLSVAKRASAQSALFCAPTTVEVGQTAICSGTVSDPDGGTKTSPTGTTSWTSTGAGSFDPSNACDLVPTATLGVSRCDAIAYTPTDVGTHMISSAYSGDGNHLPTGPSSAGALTVVPASTPPGDGDGSGADGSATQPPPGATGLRAAALKKCKKKSSKPARKKCRKNARKLPL